MSESYTIKKSYTVGAVIVLVFVAFLSFSGFSFAPETTGQVVQQTTSGEVQQVTLRFTNTGYVMDPSTLRAGVPVRMEADMNSVFGCMRDVVIPDFNVRKIVRAGDNIIEFTPDKVGTFTIRCSMNMGRGSFSVTNDGAATQETQVQQAAIQQQQAPVACDGIFPEESA